MKHYDGGEHGIGVFDYGEDFKIEKTNSGDRLFYIGNEPDGSKIRIPEGIKECEGMFSRNESLTTPPVIPSSVKACNYMFAYCKALKEAPEIPDGVLSCYGMFLGCESLTKKPKIPDSVWNTEEMFDECKNIASDEAEEDKDLE